MSQANIIPSAEPFLIPGGKTGCLLLHGWTGTPKEMRMLGDPLAADGYTVLAPRLFGHATSPQDMDRACWRDWVASVEDGMHLLKGCTEQQVVMGLSMGGILALLAAARFDFAGVVTFSAPCALPPDPRAKFLPLLAPFRLKISKGAPDWHNPDMLGYHVDYPYYHPRWVIELQKLIRVMRNELRNIRIPALLVQSRLDNGIPAESLDTLLAEIGSSDKSALWVQHSGHVVIEEPDREEVFTAVKSFLKKIEPLR